jgi:acyl-[acyl-carrier-protein]-phospholipid O-acyltransferase/long-chain-fatty-acid--[acyl-carrier-protein] ligase
MTTLKITTCHLCGHVNPPDATECSGCGERLASEEHRGGNDSLRVLSKDVSFLGMTVTQFLGAFNDNLFKQMVLLLCIDNVLRGGHDWQGAAQGIFAIPFVLFSGIAGWLSDRTSKQKLVIVCKFAEIGIMGAGMAAFFIGGLRPEGRLVYLFVVLACMSVHSTFFGPAKYGILPELFRERDLPTANGLIQMTTFLAIIFGTALAGFAKDQFGGQLWVVSAMCVGVAVMGTATSFAIRKTPIAQPGLKLKPSSLAIDSSLWNLLLGDRKLLGVLMVSSLFWLVAGLVPVTVNAVGKSQLQITDTRTSLMSACMGIGIAIGCVLAGKLSKGRMRFGLVTVGAWGLVAGFLLAAAIGWFGTANVPPEIEAAQKANSLTAPAAAPHNPAQWPAYLVMVSLGLFAGIFAVPLQVYLQHRPPRELKGRMIGAMNLVNWIGIVISAGLYGVLSLAFHDSRHYSWIFAVAALLLLPVAIFYRPRDEALSETRLA